jgi:hypothetical protein
MGCSNCDCKAAEDIFPPKAEPCVTQAQLKEQLQTLSDQVHFRINNINVYLSETIPELKNPGDFQDHIRVDLWAKRRQDKLEEEMRLHNKIAALERAGYVVIKRPEPDNTLEEAVRQVIDNEPSSE